MELSVMGAATVLVAAPPTLHRQGLLATLHTHWPALACTVMPDAGQLPALLRQQAYGLVVLDAALVGDALPDFLARLQASRRTQPLLLLIGPRRPPVLRFRALPPGLALRYLPRHASPTAALAAIRPYLAPAALPPPLASRPADTTCFSERELEVLRLVVADYCNEEIARRLCLSVRTVESHRRSLLQKTGARTLVGLAVQAVRQGWVAA